MSEETAAHQEGWYASLATLAELNRNIAHASDSAILAVTEATADKLFAVANATIDKASAMALAAAGSASNLELETWNLELTAQRSAATLTHTINTEDARLNFQHWETNSRQAYSSLLASKQNLRDQILANAARWPAVNQALDQAQADAAFATAEEANWRAETTIDNAVALLQATADAALWTAEEAANLAGTQTIDTALNIPWTHYLVNEAQAHMQWWGATSDPATAAGKYIQWVKDENTAQFNYTDALAQSHHDEMEGNTALGIVGIDKAKKDYAWNLALTAQARDVDEANARYSEINAMLVPTKAYLDDVAQLDHNYAIALANYAAQRATNEANGMDADSTSVQYEIAVESAQESYDSTLELERENWANADATAVSTWYTRVATDEHDATSLWINQEVQYVQISASREDEYAHAADAMLVSITDARDTITKAFTESRAASWLAALGNLVTSNFSPWAKYLLNQETAYRDDYLLAADIAQATLDHGTATAEETELDSEADDIAAGEIAAEAAQATAQQATADTKFSDEIAEAPVAGTEAAEDLPQFEDPGPKPTAPTTNAGPAEQPLNSSPPPEDTRKELIAPPEEFAPNQGENPPAADTPFDASRPELLAPYYAGLVSKLSAEIASRAWYERQKQRYLAGEITSIPEKPAEILPLPEAGAPVLDVTLPAITSATGLKALDPSDPDQVPFIALEFGNRIRLLDQAIASLQSANLSRKLDEAKRNLAEIRASSEPNELSLLQATNAVSAVEDDIKRLPQLIAQRCEIAELFANTDIGRIPVPILKTTGDVTRSVGVGGIGLDEAVRAAASSDWFTANHGLGESFNPIDIIVPGKPIYFLSRGTFLEVARSIVASNGRITIELVAQKGIAGAALSSLKPAAVFVVGQIRRVLTPSLPAGFDISKGFATFAAFKKAFGEAGPGLAWHHIVEQTINSGRFAAELIHNPANLIKLPAGKGTIHAKISGYYSSKIPGLTGDLTVRQWLATKSFKEQFEFGVDVIKQFGGTEYLPPNLR